MIQLRALSGNSTGKLFVAKAFPFSFGRGGANHLSLAEPGVFEKHFEIRFSPEGYLLSPVGEAPVSINGEPTSGAILRNGDVIGAGYAKFEFALAAALQKALALREVSVWSLILLVAALQAFCLVWLISNAR